MGMNPALAELLAKKNKPAEPAAPVETKAEELKATVAALKTAQAAGDKVNPPEAQQALEAAVEPAPVEGAKVRKGGKKAEKPPEPERAPERGTTATGEIAWADANEECIELRVLTKTWPTSRKVAITFLPE